MRQRLSLASFIASAALLLSAGAALAGGWATVTLDPGTTEPTAGEPVTVGFTVLQHGKTPVGQGNVIVEATGPDGQVFAFPARPEGKAGHWVVEMTLPAAGSWSWAVTIPEQLEVQTHFAPLQVSGASPIPAIGGALLPIIFGVAAGLALVTLFVLRGGMRTFASRALQRP
jgi:hypothetical protein